MNKTKNKLNIREKAWTGEVVVYSLRPSSNVKLHMCGI